jgi:ribosomal protein S18 acetylase RimI-like enzyme
MTIATSVRGGFAVREATVCDNDALVTLAAACPMRGAVSLCVDRAPDFFALNRLEGDRWRVGVAVTGGGELVGCIAAATRTAYIGGVPARIAYVSDLKVHPAYRNGSVADALSAYACGASRELGGNDVPISLTILAGNRSMERRIDGPRGLPVLRRVATIRAHAVSMLWRRGIPESSVTVAPGTERDLEEMAALWKRVAQGRQLASWYDADSLAGWIRAAPALDMGAYLLARRHDGRLVGFLGMWDQAAFKQLRVTAYSTRLASFRAGFNAVAPLMGAAALPAVGAALRHLTAVHVCVPGDEPQVLRALLLHAYAAARRGGYAFFTIGLDVRDPLTAALRGLLAQPTDIHAYVTAPSGRYRGSDFGEFPFHYEIALA